MGTTGTFDFNLSLVGETTNYTIQVAEFVMAEIAEQGSLIGLGIAIAIALLLIFGAVFIALDFIPRMIKSVKNLRR